MNFKEKIDIILKENELGITSISALEDHLRCGRGAILNFYRREEYPGNITLRKIKTLENLNKDWWDTGAGRAFEENVVNEPEVKSYANQLILTLRLTNDHLFQLTEDQRDRIAELERQVKQLKAELENKNANER